MKKILFYLMAIAICISISSSECSSQSISDIQKYVGKRVAVFTSGNQFNYDQDKRVLQLAGNEGAIMAQSSYQMITNMLSMYGGKVISQQDEAYQRLLPLINSMDSNDNMAELKERAQASDIDYIFSENLDWMMYMDLLYIYDYQISVLDVRNNVIDRSSKCFYINALKDFSTIAAKPSFNADIQSSNSLDALGDGIGNLPFLKSSKRSEDKNMFGTKEKRAAYSAVDRLSFGHLNQIKDAASRITPRLLSITGISKNGKTVDMIPGTFAGYYEDDIFHIYDLSIVNMDFYGSQKLVVKLNPLAESVGFRYEEPKIIATLDKKIELAPTVIASAGDMTVSDIPGYIYETIPIVLMPLDEADNESYANYNRKVVNYALYNAVHKNKMLEVIADPAHSTVQPQYECHLTEYSENENIAKMTLKIIDKSDNSIKSVPVESHISNLQEVIAAHVNAIFGSPAILGTVDKKQISFFVERPLAFAEGEQFMLSLADDNHTDIAIYELISWKGQEYVFDVVKILDKKMNSKIGKDPRAKYILTRYVEVPKNLMKDNSEYHKVAKGTKLMNLM